MCSPLEKRECAHLYKSVHIPTTVRVYMCPPLKKFAHVPTSGKERMCSPLEKCMCVYLCKSAHMCPPLECLHMCSFWKSVHICPPLEKCTCAHLKCSCPPLEKCAHIPTSRKVCAFVHLWKGVLVPTQSVHAHLWKRVHVFTSGKIFIFLPLKVYTCAHI